MAKLISADAVNRAVTFIESSLTVDRDGPSEGEDALLDIKIECSEWNTAIAEGGELMDSSLVFGLDATMKSDSESPRELMRAAMKVIVLSSCPINDGAVENSERRLLESAVSTAYSTCRDRIYLLSSTSPMGTLLLQDIDVSEIAEDVLREARQGSGRPQRD